MPENNKFIRFDWAAKRILRDKANFGVLEGLLTVLLDEHIEIGQILESDSNLDCREDKSNCFEVNAINGEKERIIVEIRLTRELHYLERILFSASKAVDEHIPLGAKYDKVKKVYSISILYFDLGRGSDYLYHGTTSFIGVHTGDKLEVSTKEENIIHMRTPETIFPEYFLIRVNEFNQVATTPLEEWIEYLKSGSIKEGTTVPGLREVSEKLQYLSMSEKERRAYDEYINIIMIQNDVLDTAKMEGRAEGRKEWREWCTEGAKLKAVEIAGKLKEAGMDVEDIVRMTGLSIDEVNGLS